MYAVTRVRVLSPDEVESLSYDDLSYVINEIYARHGVKFSDPNIQKTFSAMSWYHPADQITTDNVEQLCSEIESRNLSLLRPLRDARKPWPGELYPETRYRILSQEEVDDMSYAKLRYALNEIYARHGGTFSDRSIQALFSGFSWYHENSTTTYRQIEAEFSAIEKANVVLLAAARDGRKKPGATTR